MNPNTIKPLTLTPIQPPPSGDEAHLAIPIPSGCQPFEGAASPTIHFDTGVSRSREVGGLELSNDSFRAGLVQIRLKRLVVVPAADFHDDAGIHPFLD
jgi:hypothetical protein